MNRPALRAALDDVRAGRADALLVSKLDRLSRTMGDFVGLMAQARKEGWTLVALDLPLDISTPLGEAMTHVAMTFSQLERCLIGQRTKEALAARRAQGVRLGAPPAIATDLHGVIVDLREGGATLRAIADHLNAAGLPTPRGGAMWRPSSIQRALARRVLFADA